MTNTSPAPLTASCPTDVKIGGAMAPASSMLRMTCDGARHMATASYRCRAAHRQDGGQDRGPSIGCLASVATQINGVFTALYNFRYTWSCLRGRSANHG